jgi:hypothetical protein
MTIFDGVVAIINRNWSRHMRIAVTVAAGCVNGLKAVSIFVAPQQRRKEGSPRDLLPVRGVPERSTMEGAVSAG